MAKRSAGSYLTDQNWNEDEEAEEAGSFSQASTNVIEHRQIRKAKRRNITTGESTTSGTGGVFKGFSGLTSTNAKPAFSFGGSSSKGLFGLHNGSSSSAASTSTTVLSAQSLKGTQPAITTSTASSEMEEDRTQFKGADKPTTGKTDYLQHLKTLNEGLSRWVKDHVDKNPYCILTPIFKDYEKHLANIEKKYPEKSKSSEEIKPPSNKDGNEATSADSSTDITEAKAKMPTFSFGSGLKASGSSTDTGSTSLGGSTTFGGASTFGGFSFKPFTAASDSTTASKPFSLASTESGIKPLSTSAGDTAITAPKPFSFAVTKAQTDSENGGSQDEDYQPPKTEVTEVQEEGSFYTKRCKLFFKKEESWVEKGIGNIHLKECQEKIQLIIRADTNLGNILLNVLVSGSTPLSRQGKNNVTLICVPNPPLNEKKPDDKTPVSMLIRVKTAEDADELLSKLKKN